MENNIEDRIETKYRKYLNCETDTLELTIEEAIFILENNERDYYVDDLLKVAYKVIFLDYKKVLKENEKLRTLLKQKDKQVEQYVNMLATNDLLHIKESQEKDKIIDLMANEIANNITNTCPLEDYNYDLDCENKCNDNYKECWKQYFENKAKEIK